MYGQASELVAFRLMPLEEIFRRKLEADWSSQLINEAERTAAFSDRSIGKITSWKWDFGDGKTSTDRNPIHIYEKPDNTSPP